jgi:hypothetical protein
MVRQLSALGLPMNRKLTTRQLKFVSGKLEGKSNARAAREAGYSDSVANVAGRKIMGHPAVQAKLEQLMSRAGLTDDYLVRFFHGPDGRFPRIDTVQYKHRIWIRSLILSLSCGDTDAALSSLRSLQNSLQPPKHSRRWHGEITNEELWRRLRSRSERKE